MLQTLTRVQAHAHYHTLPHEPDGSERADSCGARDKSHAEHLVTEAGVCMLQGQHLHPAMYIMSHRACLAGEVRAGMPCRSKAALSCFTGSAPTAPSFSKRLVSLMSLPAASAVCSTGKLKQNPTTGLLLEGCALCRRTDCELHSSNCKLPDTSAQVSTTPMKHWNRAMSQRQLARLAC